MPAKTASALANTLNGTGELSPDELDRLGDVRTLRAMKPWPPAFMRRAEQLIAPERSVRTAKPQVRNETPCEVTSNLIGSQGAE